MLLASLGLSCVLAASAASSQATSGGGISHLSWRESRLLDIEIAVSFCTRLHPEAGRDLADAYKDWKKSNRDSYDSFLTKLTADPVATSSVKASLSGLSEATYVGDVGLQSCRKLAADLREPGGIDRMDPNMAAGQYYQYVVQSQAMQPACTRHYPSLANAIAEDERAWEAQDSRIRATVMAMVADWRGEPGANMDEMIDEAKKMHEANVEDAVKRGVGREFCRQTFALRASGQIRRQHPEIYKALERAPVKK